MIKWQMVQAKFLENMSLGKAAAIHWLEFSG